MWVAVFVRYLRFSAEKRERREESYDLKSAAALFNECVENLKKDSPVTEVYLAALSFLARSSEAGVYYRQEVDGMDRKRIHAFLEGANFRYLRSDHSDQMHGEIRKITGAICDRGDGPSRFSC